MAVKSLVGLMANVSDSDINTFFTPMVIVLYDCRFCDWRAMKPTSLVECLPST